MGKTYKAQSLVSSLNMAIAVDGVGNVTAVKVSGEVNFGDMGREETLDIWPLITEAQKVHMQQIYEGIGHLFRKHILE